MQSVSHRSTEQPPYSVRPSRAQLSSVHRPRSTRF